MTVKEIYDALCAEFWKGEIILYAHTRSGKDDLSRELDGQYYYSSGLVLDDFGKNEPLTIELKIKLDIGGGSVVLSYPDKRKGPDGKSFGDIRIISIVFSFTPYDEKAYDRAMSSILKARHGDLIEFFRESDRESVDDYRDHLTRITYLINKDAVARHMPLLAFAVYMDEGDGRYLFRIGLMKKSDGVDSNCKRLFDSNCSESEAKSFLKAMADAGVISESERCERTLDLTI